MKIAITDASGHIGSCLIRELLKASLTACLNCPARLKSSGGRTAGRDGQEGNEVKALVHNTDFNLKEPDIETVKGSVLDVNALDKLCENVDIVYHLAAKITIQKKDEARAYQVNVEGTKNLVNCCKQNKVKKLVHFSSIHAFDPQPLNRVMDESRALTNNKRLNYERSKADSEKIVLKAVEDGLPAVILNPTAVIGPYDFNLSYLGLALIKIYQNKLPVLIPGGYDWLDVRDVAKAAFEAAKRGRVGERYILSGHWLSLKGLSEIIGKISGTKTAKMLVPFFIAGLGLPFITALSAVKNEHPLYTKESLDILRNSPKFISSEKAKRELGFHSRSLEETLNDTFEWYKQNGIIK